MIKQIIILLKVNQHFSYFIEQRRIFNHIVPYRQFQDLQYLPFKRVSTEPTKSQYQTNISLSLQKSESICQNPLCYYSAQNFQKDQQESKNNNSQKKYSQIVNKSLADFQTQSRILLQQQTSIRNFFGHQDRGQIQRKKFDTQKKKNQQSLITVNNNIKQTIQSDLRSKTRVKQRDEYITKELRDQFQQKLQNLDKNLKELRGDNYIQLQNFYRYSRPIVKKHNDIQEMKQTMKKSKIMSKSMFINKQNTEIEVKSGESSIDSSENDTSITSSKLNVQDDYLSWKQHINQIRQNQIEKRNAVFTTTSILRSNQKSKWERVKYLLPLIVQTKYRQPKGLYEVLNCQNLLQRNFQKSLVRKGFQFKESREFANAVKQGDIEKVRFLLKNNSRLVNDIDHALQTALHLASRRGYLDLCSLLIKYKCDLDCVDSARKTPLYYAIEWDHKDIVKLLIRNGACPWSDEYCRYQQFRSKEDFWKIIKVSRRLHVLIAMTKKPAQAWEYFKKNFLEDFILPPELL